MPSQLVIAGLVVATTAAAAPPATLDERFPPARVTHDYWTDLRALQPPPDGEPAWPMHRELWKTLLQDLRDIGPAMFAEPVDAQAVRQGDEAAVEHLRRLEAFLEAHRGEIRTLHEAAAADRLGLPMTPEIDPELREWLEARGRDAWHVPEGDNPPIILGQWPHIFYLRLMGRVLRREAEIAALRDRPDAAVDAVEAMLGLAGQADDWPIGVGVHSSSSIMSWAAEAVLELLPGLRLTEEQLSRLDRAFDVEPPRFDDAVEGFALTILDVIQRVYSHRDDGEPALVDPRSFPLLLDLLESAAPPLPEGFENAELAELMRNETFLVALGVGLNRRRVDRAAAEREVADLAAAALLTLQGPFWEKADGAYGEVETRLFDREQRSIVVDLFVLNPRQDRRIREEAIHLRDAARLAVALERFRLRHGAYPETLDALTPALLPEIPPDRLSGKPFLYRRDNGAAILYSVGLDRDDDNAAREASHTYSMWLPLGAAEGLAERHPEETDGDWILYDTRPVPGPM